MKRFGSLCLVAADWSALVDGFNKNSEFLGSIQVREVKEWGSASVSSIVAK